MKKEKKVTAKKRLIVSLKNLPEDAKEAFAAKYEEGYNDFIQRIDKPDGTPMFLVPLETEDTDYMVKVDVKIGSQLTDEDFEKEFRTSKEDEDLVSDIASEEDNNGSYKLSHGDYAETSEAMAKEDMSAGGFSVDIDSLSDEELPKEQ